MDGNGRDGGGDVVDEYIVCMYIVGCGLCDESYQDAGERAKLRSQGIVQASKRIGIVSVDMWVICQVGQ